ncbi:transporter substrate-binding domain-containing protein [Paraburkholderia sacchari]|uniref:transporter substrate-binding domain-containing protein n=1 Tax=Paraburkholderia sacchari TaxID=159450 RepID=UPI000543D597|nr:transporter substrate-binding domain-containing protein [Paraburkholderia sacchari]NLP60159.1 transporter substrate-binding domain-containing protein [Paraburkholderia sacchari]
MFIKRRMLGRLVALAVCGVSMTLAASAQAKDWTSVTIATEGSYEPWNITFPGGKLGGFEPELMQNLCARIKIECKLVAQDWDAMIPGLRAGKFDVLMDAIMVTPEREKVIAFSRPYALTPGAFVSTDPKMLSALGGPAEVLKLTGEPKGDKPAVDRLRAALKGRTIGIQIGTAYTDFINKNFKDIATIREYKKAPERDLDLASGRIDVAFDDVSYFAAVLQQPENKSLAFVGPKIGGTIWGPGEALAFRQNDGELKAKFDAALTAALADGTVKRLSQKWFSVNITP